MASVHADDGADLPSDHGVANEIDNQTVTESTSTTQKLGLFDLAQEIRGMSQNESQLTPPIDTDRQLSNLDIIFDYAYPEVKDFQFLLKYQWADRQYDAKVANSSHVDEPFPALKVDEFMVNKAFFEHAARAWIGNQWIPSLLTYRLDTPVCKLAQDTVIGRFATKVCGAGCSTSNCYPNLKQLRYCIYVQEFLTAGKYPWVDVYTDEEIRAAVFYRDAVCFSGLTHFEVDVPFDVNSRDWNQSQKDIWAANVKRFEELARAEVFRPREPDRFVSRLYAKKSIFDRLKPIEELWPEWKDVHVTGDEVSGNDRQQASSSEHENKKQEETLSFEDRLLARFFRDPESTVILDPNEMLASDADLVKVFAREPRKVLNWIRAADRQLQQAEVKPQYVQSLVQGLNGHMKEIDAFPTGIKAKMTQPASPSQFYNQGEPKSDVANRERSQVNSATTKKFKTHGTKESLKTTASKSAKPRLTWNDSKIFCFIMAMVPVVLLCPTLEARGTLKNGLDWFLNGGSGD